MLQEPILFRLIVRRMELTVIVALGVHEARPRTVYPGRTGSNRTMLPWY
jgi:hypothetical protein